MAEPLVALVTGAAGFVGSRLIRRLIHDQWQVHAIVRSTSNLSQLQGCRESLHLHIHNGTSADLVSIFNTAKPSIVFHLASHVTLSNEIKEIEPLITSNLLFGSQLSAAMAETGVSNLINTGTSWQHHNNEPYNPVCLYAATKQAFQDILTFYTETAQLRIITLELFDTYGPGDPRNKLLNLLVSCALSRQPLELSPGNQYLDLIHVEDVVEVYMRASARLLSNSMAHCSERYTVSSGSSMTVRELVAAVEELIGDRLPVLLGKRPYRTRETMIPWSIGVPFPGWHPQIPLNRGLRQMLDERK